jgi:hypothetical protein
MNGFYREVMRLGARLIFWIAIILLVIQVVDDVAAITVAARMNEQSFGPAVSYMNLIPKLIEAFTWPVLLLAAAMIIDRLDVRREDPRK